MQRILVGRIGSAEDLVSATVFLSSDEAGYVTGRTISVDGGWTVK